MADMKDRIKNGIENVADKAKTATDKAADACNGAGQGQGLVDRLKEGSSQLVEKAGEYMGQAREKVAEWAGDGGDGARRAGEKVQQWTGEAYDYTSEKVGDFGKEVTSLIRKHPVPAILIGIGVGLLLGRTARMI